MCSNAGRFANGSLAGPRYRAAFSVLPSTPHRISRPTPCPCLLQRAQDARAQQQQWRADLQPLHRLRHLRAQVQGGTQAAGQSMQRCKCSPTCYPADSNPYQPHASMLQHDRHQQLMPIKPPGQQLLPSAGCPLMRTRHQRRPGWLHRLQDRLLLRDGTCEVHRRVQRYCH